MRASSIFSESLNTQQSQLQRTYLDDEEHDYPFYGTKHLNPIGENEEPVKMSLRTSNDFGNINKLLIQPVRKSKTNYEKYLGFEKIRTRGLF